MQSAALWWDPDNRNLALPSSLGWAESLINFTPESPPTHCELAVTNYVPTKTSQESYTKQKQEIIISEKYLTEI